MKLATPLTVYCIEYEGDYCRDANGASVPWEAVLADHARLTADLADAVAALKVFLASPSDEWGAAVEGPHDTLGTIMLTPREWAMRRARALVARVEARA